MKKDIVFPKVEDIAMAVVKEEKDDQSLWRAYLLNLKKVEISGVLVASKGYGQQEGRTIKTSVLRHFYEMIGPRSYAMIELITDNLIGISNEFWVSFYQGKTIYDKKYVFVAESIQENNLTQIPLLGRPGILIR